MFNFTALIMANVEAYRYVSCFFFIQSVCTHLRKWRLPVPTSSKVLPVRGNLTTHKIAEHDTLKSNMAKVNTLVWQWFQHCRFLWSVW
jgi:hypothetical protein